MHIIIHRFHDCLPLYAYNWQCFTKCVFTGLDVVKNNTLNTEKVKKLYAVLEDKPDVKDIAEKCKDTYNGADTCDEAWEMFKCYMDFDRE